MPLLKPKTPAPAVPGAQQRSPSGYVNLSELLGLNADKANQMGHALVDPVGQQAFNAKRAIGQASTAFGQQKQAGTVTYTGNRPKAEAEKMAAARYTGPTSLQQVAPNVGGQVQSAAQAVQQIGTDSGRASLLQQQTKASGYGAGASAFDAYLAGEGAQPQLQALQANYGDLAGLLGVAENKAGADADVARTASADAASRYAADVAGMGRQYRSRSAGEDAALTAAHNADLRGQQGRDRISGGDRIQQTSDLDWMLKSGRISSKDYDRALDDPQYFQSLMAQHG